MNSGEVSAATHDWLNKGLVNIIDKMKDLKETLEQEEDFWRSSLHEQMKALERILTSLEFRYISGDIDVKEWERVRTILTLGLDSMKSMTIPSTEPRSRPDPPNPVSDEEIKKDQIEETGEPPFSQNAYEETIPEAANLGAEKEDRNLEDEEKSCVKLESQEKRKRRSIRKKAKTRGDFTTGVHCRNPWNGECTNTDIGLSIYYEGEFLPICHKCWREISERNLEWSGI